MLDFEEEISRFTKSLEVGQIEDIVKKQDITDLSDLMMELLKHRGE